MLWSITTLKKDEIIKIFDPIAIATEQAIKNLHNHVEKNHKVIDVETLEKSIKKVLDILRNKGFYG